MVRLDWSAKFWPDILYSLYHLYQPSRPSEQEGEEKGANLSEKKQESLQSKSCTVYIGRDWALVLNWTNSALSWERPETSLIIISVIIDLQLEDIDLWGYITLH